MSLYDVIIEGYLYYISRLMKVYSYLNVSSEEGYVLFANTMYEKLLWEKDIHVWKYLTLSLQEYQSQQTIWSNWDFERDRRLI